MNCSALRLLAGNQLRLSMTAYPDCFVPMCWAENRAGSTRSSISLEGVVIAVCR
jgi:hypothetical protein